MNTEQILKGIEGKAKAKLRESEFSKKLKDIFNDDHEGVVYQRVEDKTTSGRPDVSLIHSCRITQIELKTREMPSRAFKFSDMYRPAQRGYYTSHLPFRMKLYTAVYFGNTKKGVALLFNLADIQDVMRGGKYTIEQLRELSCAEGLGEVCQYLAETIK